MKTMMQTKKKPRIEQIHHVRYLNNAETQVYKPQSDKKGIYCQGDKFGYIVEWQVEETRTINAFH